MSKTSQNSICVTPRLMIDRKTLKRISDRSLQRYLVAGQKLETGQKGSE